MVGAPVGGDADTPGPAAFDAEAAFATQRANQRLVAGAHEGNDAQQAELHEMKRERRLQALPEAAPGADTVVIGDPDEQMPLRMRAPGEHLDLIDDINQALTGKRRESREALERLDAHPDRRLSELTRQVRKDVRSRTGRQYAAHAVSLTLDRNAAIAARMTSKPPEPLRPGEMPQRPIGQPHGAMFYRAANATAEMEKAVDLAHPRDGSPPPPRPHDEDLNWPESSEALAWTQRERDVRELEAPRYNRVARDRYTVPNDRDSRPTHQLVRHLMHPTKD